MFFVRSCTVAIIVLSLTNIVFSTNVPNSNVKDPVTRHSRAPLPHVQLSKPKNLPLSKSSINKNVGTKRNYTGGQIITTRFGSQCECVTYHLCDAKDVFQDENGQSVDCQDKVCCSIPQLQLTTPPGPIIPGASITTNRYTDPPSSENNNIETCTCVEADLCTELTRPDIIDNKMPTPTIYRGDCGPTQICCPNKTSTPIVPDPPTTPPSTHRCQCISKVRCQDPACLGYNPDLIVDRTTTADSYCKNGEMCSYCDPSEICCPFEWIITDPYASAKPCETPNSKPKSKGCGYAGGFDELGQKISNGRETISGEYPWTALILKKEDDGRETIVCGGSLLSPKVILTAAHCVNKYDKSTLIVRLGEYNIETPSDQEKSPHQDRSISDVIIHEHFVKKINWNDVAIVIVNTPFVYANNVAPICFPYSVNSSFADPTVYDGTKCVVAGWGKNTNDGQFSTTLRRVDLRVVPADECQEKLRRTDLGPKFYLHKSFTCAVGENGEDSCKGDGGGPLFCALKSDANRYVQIGIVSWGLKDCGSGVPGIYSSVYDNSPWITQQFLVYNNFVITDQ